MPNVDRPAEIVLPSRCCGRCESFEWIHDYEMIGKCTNEKSNLCGEGIVLMVIDGQRCKQFKEAKK